MPTNAALDSYYADYFKSPLSSASHEKITIDDHRRFGVYLASRFGKHLNRKHVRILDFGGGDGAISYYVSCLLVKAGVESVELMIVDYNETPVRSQDERIRIDRKSTLEEIGASRFDIVIASAIIEHIPQPAGVLHSLLGSLEAGGVFYARTPCIVPLMRLLRLVGLRIDFTYPAHVHDLGQDFWETYFRKPGFEMLVSKPSIVETTLKRHFLRTIVAYALKAPWYLFGRNYRLVGGWEVFVKKADTQRVSR